LHNQRTMPVSVAKALVNMVNPRLVLYTRAAFLALCILVLNYAVVAVLSGFLMGICTTVTTSEKTSPIVSGGFFDQEAWVNDTFAREAVVNSGGGVTITTSVDACHEKSLAPVSVPFPGCYDNDWNSIPCGVGTEANVGSQTLNVWTASRDQEYAFRGTGRIVMLPCWRDDLPCTAGRLSWDDASPSGWFGCGYYEGYQVYAGVDTSYDYQAGAYGGRSAAFMHAGNEMGEKMKRFGWCSADAEQRSMARFNAMLNVPSAIAQRDIRLSILCTDPNGIMPGGVTQDLYPEAGANPGIPGAHEPAYTSYWKLNVTTTTETCPTFATAFANAFAYAAQIEMVITIALVFAFRQTGIIKLADGSADKGVAAMARRVTGLGQTSPVAAPSPTKV